jgi:Gamma-glutamyltransferase
MQNNGGLISKEDLAAYKAVERTPMSGDYRGYQVYSMPAPSSGGIHIVQILNILENFDMQKYGFGSADAMQVMADAEEIRLRRPLGISWRPGFCPSYRGMR